MFGFSVLAPRCSATDAKGYAQRDKQRISRPHDPFRHLVDAGRQADPEAERCRRHERPPAEKHTECKPGSDRNDINHRSSIVAGGRLELADSNHDE